jgi:Protein of unknown function (DUF4232)
MPWITVPVRRLVAAALIVCAGALAPGAAGARVTRAGTPRCTTAGLVIWLAQGSGTAGSVYYNIEFTNESGHACTLSGYPGVSAVDVAHRQLGSSASRDTSVASRTVTVANGATAIAVLRLVSIGALPASRCRPASAAGLRIYPPNRREAKIIPFPFSACSRGGERYLSVRAVQKR